MQQRILLAVAGGGTGSCVRSNFRRKVLDRAEIGLSESAFLLIRAILAPVTRVTALWGGRTYPRWGAYAEHFVARLALLARPIRSSSSPQSSRFSRA
ncbi:MAG: hypothetical protein ACRECR_00875 [Thermoplasmata archaeon]